MKTTFECEVLLNIGDTFFAVDNVKNFDVHKYVVIGYGGEFSKGYQSPYYAKTNQVNPEIKYLRYYICDENGYGSYIYDSDLRSRNIFKTKEEVEKYLLSEILSNISKEEEQ